MEDAICKEHSVSVLVREQIGRSQHGPASTAVDQILCESNHDVKNCDETVIFVGAQPCRGFRDCYLLQTHRGAIVQILAHPNWMADPNAWQWVDRNGLIGVDVLQIDVCKLISIGTNPNMCNSGQRRNYKMEYGSNL